MINRHHDNRAVEALTTWDAMERENEENENITKAKAKDVSEISAAARKQNKILLPEDLQQFGR